MNFNSNRAWQQAVASVSANRAVLYPVAGVFFLLPAVIMAYFFSDIQAQVLASFADPDAAAQVMAGETGIFIIVGLISTLIQLIGYLAVLALLTDRQRPTVGEALAIAIGSLPALIGAVLVFGIGYLLLGIVFGLLGSVLAAMSATLAYVAMVLFLALLIYLAIRLSLTLPVIVIERNRNPVRALQRSWELTRDHAPRLLLFYLLLGIAYIFIAIVLMVVVGGIVALFGEPGTLLLLVSGVVSGLVTGVASVIFAAVLAAIHRQLAGPSPEAENTTIE